MNKLLQVGMPNIGDRLKFFRYTEKMFNNKWLSNDGPLAQELEQKIAAYHQVKHCVATCNGTIALEIAEQALGMTGEVIVPALTFVATAHSLAWRGIKPVFADINADVPTLDPRNVITKITRRTTGIIGVHLYGKTGFIEILETIAEKYHLKLIFDAAHAFGCSHGGQMIGGFGDCEVLSFHATKIFNTFEGGAILTNNDETAEMCKILRNFGMVAPGDVRYIGTNGKMSEAAAAMGLTNLEAIDDIIAHNYKNYKAYEKELDGIKGIKLFKFQELEKNNYHYIIIILNDDYPLSRDKTIETLARYNIIAKDYFWPGLDRLSPYEDEKDGVDLLNTVVFSERVIALPNGLNVNVDDVKRITDILKKPLK